MVVYQTNNMHISSNSDSIVQEVVNFNRKGLLDILHRDMKEIL